MATVHGKDFSITYNSVSLTPAAKSGSMSVDVDLADVTVSNSAAKTFIEGDYGATHSLSGPADFGAGLQEVTTFGQIGSGAANIVWKPSTAAVGAANPSYTQSAFVSNFTLNFDVGADINHSTSWQGSAAVTRATT